MCGSVSARPFSFFVGALFVTTTFVISTPGEAQENPFATEVDARMGRRMFVAECGRCHGRDGKGNEETGAPDLTRGRFRSASTDAGLFEVVRDGIPGTAMIGIGWAPDATVWQIVAYLNSMRIDPGDYDLPGSVDRGRQFFTGKGNCASCHMVQGSGGRLGLDLPTVAKRRKPPELKSDLPEPDETVEPRGWTVKVVRADGSTVEGLRMNEDTFTLRLMDANEKLWHFLQERAPLHRAHRDLSRAERGNDIDRERSGGSRRVPLLAAEGEWNMRSLLLSAVLGAAVTPLAAQEAELPGRDSPRPHSPPSRGNGSSTPPTNRSSAPGCTWCPLPTP